ncbi:hypothetical protein ABT187_43275 [Streptomyces sp. NPDC001817]|uniref:hypothetical protein n=1 Tax=Streptomyces sp. NPDC001817 TaxID=3154398 RepID=UPI0033180BB9
MDTQAERWEALRAGFASLRADLAEVAAEIADIGVQRTAALLTVARYVARYGVRVRVAPVAPVAVPIASAPVSLRDTPRPSVGARFHHAVRAAFAPVAA